MYNFIGLVLVIYGINFLAYYKQKSKSFPQRQIEVDKSKDTLYRLTFVFLPMITGFYILRNNFMDWKNYLGIILVLFESIALCGFYRHYWLEKLYTGSLHLPKYKIFVRIGIVLIHLALFILGIYLFDNTFEENSIFRVVGLTIILYGFSLFSSGHFNRDKYKVKWFFTILLILGCICIQYSLGEFSFAALIGVFILMFVGLTLPQVFKFSLYGKLKSPYISYLLTFVTISVIIFALYLIKIIR